MRKFYSIFMGLQKRPYILAFISFRRHYDILPVEEENTKWNRLKRAFRRDDKQNISPELCTIFNNSFGGFFVGASIGGMLHARAMLYEYVERNMVTRYYSQNDAKLRLQDNVNLHFMKGAARWGIKMGYFIGLFTFFYSTVGILREKHSVWNLSTGAALAGVVYKIPLGIKGIIAGGIGGGILGLICSGVIFALLTICNRNFEDHFQWNYIVVNFRDKAMHDNIYGKGEPQDLLLVVHDGTFDNFNAEEQDSKTENVKQKEKPKTEEKFVENVKAEEKPETKKEIMELKA